MFKHKYRVVADGYLGYEAQVKLWFLPILWLQIDSDGMGLGINTCSNVLTAETLCREHHKTSWVPFRKCITKVEV